MVFKSTKESTQNQIILGEGNPRDHCDCSTQEKHRKPAVRAKVLSVKQIRNSVGDRLKKNFENSGEHSNYLISVVPNGCSDNFS